MDNFDFDSMIGKPNTKSREIIEQDILKTKNEIDKKNSEDDNSIFLYAEEATIEEFKTNIPSFTYEIKNNSIEEYPSAEKHSDNLSEDAVTLPEEEQKEWLEKAGFDISNYKAYQSKDGHTYFKTPNKNDTVKFYRVVDDKGIKKAIHTTMTNAGSKKQNVTSEIYELNNVEALPEDTQRFILKNANIDLDGFDFHKISDDNMYFKKTVKDDAGNISCYSFYKVVNDNGIMKVVHTTKTPKSDGSLDSKTEVYTALVSTAGRNQPAEPKTETTQPETPKAVAPAVSETVEEPKPAAPANLDTVAKPEITQPKTLELTTSDDSKVVVEPEPETPANKSPFTDFIKVQEQAEAEVIAKSLAEAGASLKKSQEGNSPIELYPSTTFEAITRRILDEVHPTAIVQPFKELSHTENSMDSFEKLLSKTLPIDEQKEVLLNAGFDIKGYTVKTNIQGKQFFEAQNNQGIIRFVDNNGNQMYRFLNKGGTINVVDDNGIIKIICIERDGNKTSSTVYEAEEKNKIASFNYTANSIQDFQNMEDYCFIGSNIIKLDAETQRQMFGILDYDVSSWNVSEDGSYFTKTEGNLTHYYRIVKEPNSQTKGKFSYKLIHTTTPKENTGELDVTTEIFTIDTDIADKKAYNRNNFVQRLFSKNSFARMQQTVVPPQPAKTAQFGYKADSIQQVQDMEAHLSHAGVVIDRNKYKLMFKILGYDDVSSWTISEDGKYFTKTEGNQTHYYRIVKEPDTKVKGKFNYKLIHTTTTNEDSGKIDVTTEIQTIDTDSANKKAEEQSNIAKSIKKDIQQNSTSGFWNAILRAFMSQNNIPNTLNTTESLRWEGKLFD